jgi:hypothetical protein
MRGFEASKLKLMRKNATAAAGLLRVISHEARPFSSVCRTPAASLAIVAECGRYDIPQGSSNTLR